MHNFTPRMGVAIHPSTSKNVGPTTYAICECNDNLVNKVPFLSSDQRNLFNLNALKCDQFYELPTFLDDIKGGTSPRYRSERSVITTKDIPGPATYSPNMPDCSTRLNKKMGKGRLYVCKVPYTSKYSGPSVPTRVDENGYYIDCNNNLIKVPPNFHDTSLGPAFYDVKEPFAANRYRGCRWSSRTSKRPSLVLNYGPGPADYNVQLSAKTKHESIEDVRQMARLLSFTPRYLDAQEIRIKRENLPGPGYYNVKFPSCNICGGIRPKPFISGRVRFESKIEITPSPGSYEVEPSTQYPISKSEIPFSVGAERFVRKEDNQFLGPGTYDLSSNLDDMKLFSQRYSFAPFNSTNARDTMHLKKDVAHTPSPSDYLVTDGKHCKIFPCSVFKSKVKRFPMYCSMQNNRSPYSYNAVEAFQDVNDQRSFNVTRVPFNCKAKKKGAMDNLILTNPSPDRYNSSIGSLTSRGFYIPISKRFPDPCNAIPGPGSYYIHPSHGVSIYKAFNTKNLIIKENILRKKLRKHPRDTWEKWANTVKKTKRLACFEATKHQ